MRKHRRAWNKGRLLGQKPPLKPKEIWSLRIRLQLAEKPRDLALFNLAIDSKLRGCDLVSLRVRDVYQGSVVSSRAIVMQRKTQRPVQFEITEATREAIAAWVSRRDLRSSSYLFPGRALEGHLSVRQYSRIVKACVPQ
jgi:integrase